MKIASINAGSLCFWPILIKDILINDLINIRPLEIALMDIVPENLVHSAQKSETFRQFYNQSAQIWTTTNLDSAEGEQRLSTAMVYVNTK